MISSTPTRTQEDSSTAPPDIESAFASFVGVDLHKATVSLAAADRTGQIIARIKTSTRRQGRPACSGIQ